MRRAAIALLLAACTSGPAVAASPPRSAPPQSTAPTPSATSSSCHSTNGLPDPACTPGVLNPDVTSATIATTICVSGWTATVRPAATYTNALKVDQMKAYGYANAAPGDFEEDHFIPLELGGAPRDPKNLWPQLLAGEAGATRKDALEGRLREAVCAGSMALADAQQCIVRSWIACVASTSSATRPPSAAPSAALTVAPSTAPAAASFGVTITTSVWGSLAAVTSAGATCNARARLPSGNYSTAQGITAQKVADAKGGVSWTWTRTNDTKPGTGTYTVSCALNGLAASATSTFSVP